MSFDLGEFYDLCGSIEQRLGILRANEAIREWWDNYQAELDAQNVPRWGNLPYRSNPTPFAYSVEFSYYGMPAIDGADPDDQQVQEQEAFRQVEAAAEQVWTQARQWSWGLAGYLSDICAPIIRPSESAFREVAEEFVSVREALKASLPTNWRRSGLDLASWTGETSDAFDAFLDQLHDQVDEYAAYLAHACGWWASASRLVLQAQTGLVGFLREVDDALDAQLLQWAETYGTPLDISGEVNPHVLDVLKLAGDVAGVIPVVSDLKGNAESAITITKDALNVFGVEPELTLPAEFHVQTAEEVWNGLTSTLYDDYRTKLETGLQELAPQSAAALSTIEGSLGSFYPLRVREHTGDGDRRTPEWTHPNEK